MRKLSLGEGSVLAKISRQVLLAGPSRPAAHLGGFGAGTASWTLRRMPREWHLYFLFSLISKEFCSPNSWELKPPFECWFLEQLSLPQKAEGARRCRHCLPLRGETRDISEDSLPGQDGIPWQHTEPRSDVHLAYCSVATILKFLIIFEQGFCIFIPLGCCK